MAIKELEELAFVFQVGQLVLHTAKSIIKDENLFRGMNRVIGNIYENELDLIMYEVSKFNKELGE